MLLSLSGSGSAADFRLVGMFIAMWQHSYEVLGGQSTLVITARQAYLAREKPGLEAAVASESILGNSLGYAIIN